MKPGFTYLFLIIILFGGCKKDIDDIPPEIEVYAPAPNNTIMPGDSLYVDAYIYDDEQLVELRIQLVDDQLVPAGEATVFSPSQSSYYLETWFEIDGELDTEGLYYIWLRAFDGYNYRNHYTAINIQISPPEFRYLIAITKPSSSFRDIYVIQPDSMPGLKHSFYGDYTASVVSSDNSLLYFAPYIQGDFTAFNLPDFTESWKISGTSTPPFPCFTSLSEYAGKVFLGRYNGQIKSYYPDGLSWFTAYATSSYYPAAVLHMPPYVIAALHEISGTSNHIDVYYEVSGLLKQSNYLGFYPLAMDVINDGVVLFGNSSGTGVINEYLLQTNQVNQLASLPGEEIISVCPLQSGLFLLATAQNLYQYDAVQLSMVKLTVQTGISALAFDDLNDVIFLAVNDSIQILTYPGIVYQGGYALPDSIVGLHAVYGN